MIRDLQALGTGLEDLGATFPYRHAQWLAEDPVTRDYRVIAARICPGAAGYSIAHRTGVIGQVFRTRRTIAVPDTRNHPLYDPFDTDVDWELAIPVWQERTLVAVLNLEGSGVYGLRASQWRAIGELVSAVGWRVEGTPPDATATGLVKTRRAAPRASRGRACDVVRIATRLANRGRTVLLIGVFPDVAPTVSPTVCDAEAARTPLAECVHGVGPRLDIVQLGSPAEGLRAFERLGGWKLVDGRYEFVLTSSAVQEEPGPPL